MINTDTISMIMKSRVVEIYNGFMMECRINLIIQFVLVAFAQNDGLRKLDYIVI